MRNSPIVIGTAVVLVLALCPLAAQCASFTLSDSALMSLDYDYIYYSNQSAEITGITDVAGPGVQFDILFPDPLHIRGEEPTLNWTSCIYGGSGTLTGIDIRPFDTFELKFTIISASGVSVPDETGPITVGALINQYDSSWAYNPKNIAFDTAEYPASATSATSTDAALIDFIGITCYPSYWWYNPSPSSWDPDGAMVSLLVEPAPGAAVITPEPATLFLLTLGSLFLRKHKK